jgi:hypothetical protein
MELIKSLWNNRLALVLLFTALVSIAYNLAK